MKTTHQRTARRRTQRTLLFDHLESDLMAEVRRKLEMIDRLQRRALELLAQDDPYPRKGFLPSGRPFYGQSYILPHILDPRSWEVRECLRTHYNHKFELYYSSVERMFTKQRDKLSHIRHELEFLVERIGSLQAFPSVRYTPPVTAFSDPIQDMKNEVVRKAPYSPYKLDEVLSKASLRSRYLARSTLPRASNEAVQGHSSSDDSGYRQGRMGFDMPIVVPDGMLLLAKESLIRGYMPRRSRLLSVASGDTIYFHKVVMYCKREWDRLHK